LSLDAPANAPPTPRFAVGALVRARGREWVVQPASEEDLLLLRPLGGSDEEVTGIYTPLETVEPAHFDLPSPDDLGDFHSCRRLRDAARLASRNSAGPFRSAGHLNVEPRPYQLVPLLLALRQDPVRLLIADDVGIGKTVEAGLIARELLDRAEVRRLAVLCPPHLAEQWRQELASKFSLRAELVLAGTAGRLERNLGVGESLFDRHPHVVVSTDYIKSDRRRADFFRTCPELVIVDEAHTCVPATENQRAAHLRYKLLAGLAEDPNRHLLLVTATPHSGKEEAFRRLLALLSPELVALPDDLTGPTNAPYRRTLARYFVQRRRGDIRRYLGEDTPFPEREETETTYTLHPDYRKFFDRAVAYARETVITAGDNRLSQRVRWWSALALLRALASSPAAAAATLRNRARAAGAETPEEADELGRRAVLDLVEDEAPEGMDLTPGADSSEPGAAGGTETAEAGGPSPERRRLRALAREAETLAGNRDHKLNVAIEHIHTLVAEGFRPIVFCRFIDTAEYVATGLRDSFSAAAAPSGVEVAAVTGVLTPEERESRVLHLAEAERPVLVATDCLSEGINLQEHFDAVVHYDLAWSPTRHEQREGRVDRFGQPRATVRVLTCYGSDNPIDGLILDVLLRKHKTIRNSLGIAVPLPVDLERIVETIFEGLLFREHSGRVGASQMALFDELTGPRTRDLHQQWEAAADREKRSRTVFAQETIRPEEVEAELAAARRAVGSAEDVERFTLDALSALGASVGAEAPWNIDLAGAPGAIRDLAAASALSSGGSRRAPAERFRARFGPAAEEGVLTLHRTHPLVEGLAHHVFDTALDPHTPAIARRAGVVRTRSVAERTTLLLVRTRFQLKEIHRRGGSEEVRELLAEDHRLLAFRGTPEAPPTALDWLDEAAAEALLTATPEANVPPDLARHHLAGLLRQSEALLAHLVDQATARGEALLDAHQRVRQAARATGVHHQVEAKLPVDVLGLYLYLPA